MSLSFDLLFAAIPQIQYLDPRCWSQHDLV